MLDPGRSYVWPPSVDACNSGIVDDDVFMALVTPEEATNTAATIAGIVFSEYAAAGLTLHLDAVTTAVMFHWAGDGATVARREMEALVATEGGIPFMDRQIRRLFPTTARYKHTGCWSRDDAKSSTNVVAKMATVFMASRNTAK